MKLASFRLSVLCCVPLLPTGFRRRATRTVFLVLALTGVLADHPPAANAKVFLKPNGQNAAPLRITRLEADVTIRHHVAAARTTYTFANETGNRQEADFLFTLEPGAVVTSFAYWYGDEKVVARVAEKERAAAIYQAITSRMRDPALVEMVGKNTFRARVFPVMPNADLKVEVSTVQVLPTDRQGAWYEIPMAEEDRNAAPLDRINVNVHITPEPGETVANNYGLPVQRRGEEQTITLHGSHFRPTKDLRVNLHVPMTAMPLRARLYAAPSGGRDGFFTLALLPGRELKRPVVRVAGVRIYDVAPSRLPATSAHHGLIVCGRYRGAGPAVVTLSDGTWSAQARIVFGSRREENNPAAKLWAAARIRDLYGNRRNREQVVALSLRHTIPSPFTSWLAVPKAEMARYQREKDFADVESMARTLASAIESGKGNTPAAWTLRKRLNETARRIHANPRDLLKDAQGYIVYDRVSRLVTVWKYEILKGRGNSPRSQRAHAKAEKQARRVGYSAREELSSQMARPVYEVARQWELARFGGNINGRYWTQMDGSWDEVPTLPDRRHAPDPKRAAALERRFHQLARFTTNTDRDLLRQTERQWAQMDIYPLRTDLVTELRKAAPDPQRVASLEERFLALNTVYKNRKWAEERAERLAVKVELEKLDAASGRTPAQEERRHELQRKSEDLRARMGDPLIQVDAPEDAARVVALMPGGQVKPLSYNPASRKWEARFDIPAYATEGVYTITVIIIGPDGARRSVTMRYHVDLTPPVGQGHAWLVNSPSRTLRVEMESSPDTARVTALLPWGAEVPMGPSGAPGRYFALIPVPAGRETPATVTFALTDKAHNRAAVTVDVRDPVMEVKK